MAGLRRSRPTGGFLQSGCGRVFLSRVLVSGERRAYTSCMSAEFIPTEQKPEIIYRLPSIIEKLDQARLFPRPQALEIELGSGDGSFLVEYARRNPERNFIGVERLLGRIRKMERKARRAGLLNLCGVRIESSYFLEFLLPAHSAATIHIYFPDPWPKRKHRRHRLVNESFPALAHRALGCGGEVYLRTDDQDYFAQMQEVFRASPLFQPIETPPELAVLLTDFEREFSASGIGTFRAAYRAVGALNC